MIHSTIVPKIIVDVVTFLPILLMGIICGLLGFGLGFQKGISKKQKTK